MSRKEFMAKLETLLQSIPEEERSEALQYYEDYFDDAGTEHEEEVIQELESPEKVAALIGADLKPGNEENGEFTEHGFTDERFEEKETPAMRGEHTKDGDRYSFHQEDDERRDSGGYEYGDGGAGMHFNERRNGTPPRTSKWLKILLIAAIVLVACPVAVPVIIGVAAVVFGLVVAVFAMFAAFVIAAVAVAVAGITVIIVGIVASIGIPSALLTVGIGVLMFTIGAIATVATVRLCMVMYPAIFRIIVNICRMPFHRRKAVV